MSKPSTDSAAIKQILRGLLNAGYTLREVFDGEETYPVSKVSKAVEHVTDVDSAYVYLNTPAGGTGWVWFVLGNDPEEVAADYTKNLHQTVNEVVSPWWE